MPLLNTIKKVYLGARPVDRIYKGGTLVWQAIEVLPVSATTAAYEASPESFRVEVTLGTSTLSETWVLQPFSNPAKVASDCALADPSAALGYDGTFQTEARVKLASGTWVSATLESGGKLTTGTFAGWVAASGKVQIRMVAGKVQMRAGA